jgi:hypothetical protein
VDRLLFFNYETSIIEIGLIRGCLLFRKVKAIILNPVIVITHVDASGMGVRGWGVKIGGRPDSGSGLWRTVTWAGGGARTSIGGARSSIGGGGESTIGKSIRVAARPRSTIAQTPDAPSHESRAITPPWN